MTFILREDLQHIPMCKPSANYKPFMYPWAEQATIIQQRIHWIPEEVTNFGLDKKDYIAFEEGERYLLDNALRLFTQSDINVFNNYMTLYQPIFLNGEIGRMLATFMGMEVVHVRAYAFVNDTLGLPDSVYGEFLNVEAMRAKHDLLNGFTMKDPKDIATTLALVSAFGEGLQLYSSFALMLNFSRFGKMKGLGQILAWSQRDENLHCQAITKLFHSFLPEAGLKPQDVEEPIIEGCRTTVMLEDAFIDHCFGGGPVTGLTAAGMKKYIRYTADERLKELGLRPLYNQEDHDLDWLIPLLGVEHANFFETRSTEYSKASTRGTWSEVWEQFDLVKATA